MITIAHLSDPHLSPLPRPGLRRLLSKRMLGYFNWQRGRKHVHNRQVVDLMVADIKRQSPDQIVVTGDLVNLSLEEEFHGANAWLQTLGLPDRVTVVPGNHDAYVPLEWSKSMGVWQDYMSSNETGSAYVNHNAAFPFVRINGHIAVVGLSSAVPKPPFIAAGRLGAEQLVELSTTLHKLGRDGFFRIVLIHHPPLPGQNRKRKALDDAKALKQILCEQGAELVLHGHNHTDMLQTIETVHGLGHTIGVPSASAAKAGHRPAAQYNLYKVDANGRAEGCTVTIRGFDPAEQQFRELRTFKLDTELKT